MSERAYFSLRTKAAPAHTLLRLADEIRNFQLGDEVPLIRIEKKLRRTNRPQEFYLVLAVDIEDGKLSDQLSLLIKHIFGNPQIVQLSLEDARRFTNVGVDFIENVDCIPYDPPAFLLPEQGLMAEETGTDGVLTLNEEVFTQKYQYLLYWLSSAQNGTILSLRNTCIALGLIAENDSLRPLARRLAILGHIEFASDRNHWSATPPCLIYRTDKNGKIQAHLSGQRSGSFIKSLESSSLSMKIGMQFNGASPPNVLFEFEDEEHLNKARASLETHAPVLTPAAQLAEILPGLNEWKTDLPIVEGIEAGLYKKHVWREGVFCETLLADRSGFYQLIRAGNDEGWAQHFYYDADANIWLSGDWYGLRFLALCDAGQPEAYFIKDRALAIHERHRWPYLYEKSLVMLSGILPKRADGWLIYDYMPRPTAVSLCKKLGVKLKIK